MLRGAILVFFCVFGNSNEAGDWLKCKPKPGCSIPKCDPPQGQLFGYPYKLDDYSILCQKNEPPDVSDINILEREITRMKSQMEKERNERESKFNNALKNLEEKIENKFTRWRMKAENVSCAITFNGICYWTHVQDGWNVNFTRAEEICSNKSSTPAHFPSEKIYNSVVEEIRSKIPTKYNWFYIWTGIIVNTNTGNAIHQSGDTYMKWYTGYPLTGSSMKILKHVGLDVESNSSYIHQGMKNLSPQYSRLNGVVCQSVE